MAGNELRKPYGFTVLAVAALVAAAYAATRSEQDSAVNIPPRAVGWHGAMDLYRRIAVWAGRRAMAAENKYWEAVR